MISDREWARGLYEQFARGGDDEAMFYTEVKGDPWSKARPRFTRRGRTYQPRDDLEAEQRLRWRMKAAGAHPFPGNVLLICRFYRSNFQRIDTDNLLKHVCDSANGVLWHDDSQVTFLLGETQYDPDRPRTVLLAGNHGSSLARGDDARIPCAQCHETFMPSVGRRSVQRFCSTACAQIGRSGVSLKIPVACAGCGEPFVRSTSNQRFCSLVCARTAARGVPRPNRRKPFRSCKDCGATVRSATAVRCRQCWLVDHSRKAVARRTHNALQYEIGDPRA